MELISVIALWKEICRGNKKLNKSFWEGFLKETFSCNILNFVPQIYFFKVLQKQYLKKSIVVKIIVNDDQAPVDWRVDNPAGDKSPPGGQSNSFC